MGATTAARRVGWLEIDLGLLFDEARVPRRVTVGGAVSRFPSSDIDLAFVVEDRHPADAVAEALRAAGGDLLESVTLFDVYRGAGIAEGARSLAYRLRFCAPDRTLTDEEVGALRAALHRGRRGGVRGGPALSGGGCPRCATCRCRGQSLRTRGKVDRCRYAGSNPTTRPRSPSGAAVLRASDKDVWPD